MRIALIVVLLLAPAWAGDLAPVQKLLDQGKYDQAIAAATQIVQKEPTNADAWLLLAKSYEKPGRDVEAWHCLEDAIDKNPKDARLSAELGDVFRTLASKNSGTEAGQGHLVDAESMYKEALRKDPGNRKALYGRAAISYALRKPKLASEFVQKLLEKDPKNAKAHALQARLLYDQKKYAEAASEYKTARDLDDSDPAVCFYYGNCLYAQGKMDEAKAAYLYTLKRHPSYGAVIRTGFYYLAGQSWGKLQPYLEEAVKEVPGSEPAWFYLGYAYYVTKNFDKAMADFQQAHTLEPKNAMALYYLGQTNEALQHPEKAMDDYRRALQQNSNYDAAAFACFRLLPFQQDFDKAQKLGEELIKLAPRNALLLNNFALVLRDWAEKRGAHTKDNPPAKVQARIKRSSEIYEMAVKLLPDDAQINSDTGLMFEFYPCIRDDAKAIRYFTHSLDVSDNVYRDAFDGLNRLCRRTGRWQLLADYADRVLGAIDRGKDAIAPAGGAAPAPIPQETPGLKARAQAALKDAKAHLAPKGGTGQGG